jgi:hypothetical protein
LLGSAVCLLLYEPASLESSTLFSFAEAESSLLFAKLYTELIQKKSDFYLVFQEHFDIHTSDIDQLNYVDPNVDYDEYCNYIKRVEHVKSSLLFFINLMKTNVCNLDNIVELCIKLQTKMLNTEMTSEQSEEYLKISLRRLHH